MNGSDAVSSTQAAARKSALVFLLILILAPIHQYSVSSCFIVASNAAATAGNIVAHPLTYRLGILSGLASVILSVFLALNLHRVFQDVDRRLARLMVTLMAVGIAFELVNLFLQSLPLILLSGSGVWTVFNAAQLETLAFGSLTLRQHGDSLAMAFWGLSLLPFGMLVIKSRFSSRPMDARPSYAS